MLREFWQGHPDAEVALRAWYKEAADAHWTTPADIKNRYASASILPGDRVVFKIRGNRYRLVAAIRYDLGIVFVRFVGTHKTYDSVDVLTI
jgi:mRNA interferase HigB